MSDDQPEAPQYAFKMLAVEARDDPYYVVRWDLAKPYTVVASTQPEAFEKLWALLGPAPRHYEWHGRVLHVSDVRVAPEDKT